MPKKTKTEFPRFRQSAPPEYATADQLRARGLKPGKDTRVVATLDYREKDRRSLSALFLIAEAVPLETADAAAQS